MITVEISEKEFIINNYSLTFPIAISELTSALSQPELFKGQYNNIYTFHEFGVLAYSKNEDLIDCVALVFDPKFKYDYSPRLQFNQKLSINGQLMREFYRDNKKKRDAHHSLNFGKFSLYFNDDKDNDSVSIFTISPYIQAAPKQKASKPISDKYKIRTISAEKLVFTDFNFKLAVMQELMYNQELLKPKFDLYEFVQLHQARDIDVEEEGYEFIAEVIDYFEKFEIEAALADKVTEINQDGGNDIYLNVLRFWDGEDDVFNIRSFKDITQFKNLKTICLFYYEPEDRQVLEELIQHGIGYDFV
jgi:hypothetical protein